jgi:hypothetical protein
MVPLVFGEPSLLFPTLGEQPRSAIAIPDLRRERLYIVPLAVQYGRCPSAALAKLPLAIGRLSREGLPRD